MGTTVFERRRPAPSVVAHALAGTRQASFWLEDVERPRYPRLDGELTADLAIVGGGYTGLWSAVLAKQRNPGASVVLLEARRIGWAASGRNGGFCEASLTHGRENGENRWPEELEQLERLGLENLDEIEASSAELGMDFEFERNGAIDLAVEPHQVQWLRDAAEDAAGDDGTVFLDGEALRAEVNSPSYLAGLWHKRSSAILHPAKLAIELARVATEMGVRIVENSPVKRLESGTGGADAAG
ncbi:MAG TPA: FAD-dependent oxidoreductase, partial [Microterricola sp.]